MKAGCFAWNKFAIKLSLLGNVASDLNKRIDKFQQIGRSKQSTELIPFLPSKYSTRQYFNLSSVLVKKRAKILDRFIKLLKQRRAEINNRSIFRVSVKETRSTMDENWSKLSNFMEQKNNFVTFNWYVTIIMLVWFNLLLYFWRDELFLSAHMHCEAFA